MASSDARFTSPGFVDSNALEFYPVHSDLPISSADSAAPSNGFLSRLAPELRNRIYEYALGGRHIHVRQQPVSSDALPPESSSGGSGGSGSGSGKALHRRYGSTVAESFDAREGGFVKRLRDELFVYAYHVCVVPDADADIYRQTCEPRADAAAAGADATADSSATALQPYPVRHKACLESASSDRLAPALLRTCRAVHAEAEPVLYGDNTFCFTDPSELVTFTVHLSTRQQALLRRVHLFHEVLDMYSPLGQLRQADADALAGLRALDLTLGIAKEPWMASAPQFGARLRNVQVVLVPRHAVSRNPMTVRTARRHRKKAQAIEEWILSHRREADELE